MLGGTAESRRFILRRLVPVEIHADRKTALMTPENTRRTAAVIYNPIKVDIDELRSAVDSEASAAVWAESFWYET